MKKTCVFLAGILLVIFLVYACDMPLELPSSIKFKTDDFKINAPVKIGRFNIATVISESVKSAFPEKFEVYDMVDFQDFQAFLIGYEMVLMDSFNPDDYLEDIRTQMKVKNAPDNIDPVNSDPIVIPNLTTPALPNTNWYQLNMYEFFKDMRDKINNTSTPPTSAALSYTQSTVPPELQDMTPFMVSGGDNFTSIDVAQCEIELHIWLEGMTDPDLSVDLNNITMTGAAHAIAPSSVTLSSANSANNYQTVTVNINSGETISGYTPPQFHLGGITSSYTGSPPAGTYTLVMKPYIKSISLNGAVNLKIGKGEADVPPDIVENIKKDPFPAPDMINAQIANGKFRMTVESPHYISEDTGTGLIIGYRIVLNQDPAIDIDYSFPTEHLGGKPFTDANPSLNDEWISGEPLTVNESNSKIIITADTDNGSTFTLAPDGLFMMLYIQMDMGMDVNKLAKVRWKTQGQNGPVLPPINVTPVDFGGEGGNPPVITSITFDTMILNVDFFKPEPPPSPPSSGLPEEMKKHLALSVICPKFGFSENYYDNPRVLEVEENKFNGSTPTTMLVNREDHTVPFDVKLLPVVNGQVKDENFPYMEFGEIDMLNDVNNDGEKVLNIYAEVTMDYTWSEANVDMQTAFENSNNNDPPGTFPENVEDAVDLSMLNRYMHGITFGDGIEAKVFLGGPRKLIEAIQPKIDFYAEWEDAERGHQSVPLLIRHEFKIGEILPKLPGKDFRGEFVYSGLELPEPGYGMILTNSFNDIFTSFPRNLYFRYEMILPNAAEPLTVYPDTFGEDVEEPAGEMRALLVILLPMEFIAEPGGYFALPDLFAEGEDLFGRNSPEDNSLFTGVNINKLNIKLDFGYSFLGGSNLHFDRDSILFGEEGFPLGKKNSLKVTLTGKQQSIINENLIYPSIKFVYPEERTLYLGRYSLPVKIVIDASGSYTMNLDDLGLGN